MFSPGAIPSESAGSSSLGSRGAFNCSMHHQVRAAQNWWLRRVNLLAFAMFTLRILLTKMKTTGTIITDRHPSPPNTRNTKLKMPDIVIVEADRLTHSIGHG
ncbi:hypothetical protein Leryth_025600 [Lithospermum erythrorhizon]|nr:hypothetical protein Leryth_025600 [Lithospermum erythrorhizon]